MGQTSSIQKNNVQTEDVPKSGMYRYCVSDPKTPYEFCSSDWIINESDMNMIEEYIQEQLEEDARHVEELIHKFGGGVILYERNILRVKLEPTKFKHTHAVLHRGIRVKYLMKNLKIPYTIITVIVLGSGETTIQRVYNIENKSSIPSSE